MKSPGVYLLVGMSLFLLTGTLVVFWEQRPKTTPQGEVASSTVYAQGINCDQQYPNSWPQVAHDAQRTGYSPDNLGNNVNNIIWKHSFKPDRLYPQVQGIVYCNMVYV
ncbi:hypothetical protein HY468_05690, partial [Candidatus Roizmanbacteria bacterium]|nr:hypothetical protein [Candidatus Roizmanbacteria bacterium]